MFAILAKFAKFSPREKISKLCYSFIIVTYCVPLCYMMIYYFDVDSSKFVLRKYLNTSDLQKLFLQKYYYLPREYYNTTQKLVLAKINPFKIPAGHSFLRLIQTFAAIFSQLKISKQNIKNLSSHKLISPWNMLKCDSTRFSSKSWGFSLIAPIIYHSNGIICIYTRERQQNIANHIKKPQTLWERDW